MLLGWLVIDESKSIGSQRDRMGDITACIAGRFGIWMTKGRYRIGQCLFLR